MWKKTDNEPGGPAPSLRPETSVTSATPSRARQNSGGTATIGQSITINGDVTGEEDLVIQGRIEGTVSLGTHAVTVGPEGRVKADITGRIVTVEGRVEGNILGQEHIALRSSAEVEGDLIAPRVSLEDGAAFRGRIDMSQKAATSRTAASTQSSSASSQTGSRSASTGTGAGENPKSKTGSSTG